MATSTEHATTGTDPGRTVRPDVPDVITDGRQLRRERNREAVVEALLDLYREGNLRPSTEEIATRAGLSPRSLFRYFDDVDDLTRTAVRHQHERAQHLVPIGAGPHEPLADRVDTLVAQRFRLFDAVGGFRIGFEGSQDYDLLLRDTERTDRIAHIPRVLYHWRTHSESSAGTQIGRAYV